MIELAEADVAIVDDALTPVQQRNLRKGLAGGEGHRPHRPDPGDFRPAGSHARRPPAGRVGQAVLRALAIGAHLDPPGAPARRLWRHGRPRRDPDRDRPAADRGQDPQAEGRTQGSAPYADPAALSPQAASVPDGRAGRLHQRRQVDAVQPADPRRGGGRGHAVRHPRPDAAHAEAAGRAPGDPVGHRGLHLRPAARTGRSLPRHPGGGEGGRRRPARARHRQRGDRRPGRRRAQGARPAGRRHGRALDPGGLEQARPAARRRPRHRGRRRPARPSAGHPRLRRHGGGLRGPARRRRESMVDEAPPVDVYAPVGEGGRDRLALPPRSGAGAPRGGKDGARFAWPSACRPRRWASSNSSSSRRPRCAATRSHSAAFSTAFASSQSASISARSDWSGVFPRSRSFASMYWKRRTNLAFV